MTRAEAIEKLKSYDPMSMMPAIQMAIKALEAQPKTGKWEEHIFDGIMGGRPRALRCTRCNYISLCEYNFCPHCGSMMLKEGEGHETD